MNPDRSRHGARLVVELQHRLAAQPAWCLAAAVALVVLELVLRPRLVVTFAIGYAAVALLLGIGAAINLVLAAAALITIGAGAMFGLRTVSVDAGITAICLMAVGVVLACADLWREADGADGHDPDRAPPG